MIHPHGIAQALASIFHRPTPRFRSLRAGLLGSTALTSRAVAHWLVPTASTLSNKAAR